MKSCKTRFTYAILELESVCGGLRAFLHQLLHQLQQRGDIHAIFNS
ncbi:hypothetical protein L21SP2_1455 [Salinispira pacifica]|uniref:Uncharacterized protein n=1 Tax=Salinispira pacifica TaxID=1307761 RepID=V5WG85_9SPIO|nr:hypothetical protein L21SP2_1455 [Salinispira pacifica]